MTDTQEDTTEIREYDEFTAKIKLMRDACNFLPDMEAEDGYEKSKRVALDVGKVLTRLDAKRKEIKAPALDRCKFIDSEAKSIKQEIEGFQLPHKEAYKAMDELRKKRDEKRKQGLLDRVTFIADLPENMRDSHSSEVMAAMTDLQKNECLDFYDFTHDALNARKRSLDLLGQLYTSKSKQEKDAEELVRLKAESEARERKDREEAIAKKAAEDARIAAEQKAATEKAAIEKAEQAARGAANLAREAANLAEQRAKEAVERAAKQKLEAKQAAREAADLAEKREKEAVERAAKQKLEAEQAAKQAAINAEKAAKAQAEQAAADERKRIADETAANLAAAQKREADKKHHAKINNESLADFIQGGMDEEQARMAVTLLAQKKIRHAAISY